MAIETTAIMDKLDAMDVILIDDDLDSPEEAGRDLGGGKANSISWQAA